MHRGDIERSMDDVVYGEMGKLDVYGCLYRTLSSSSRCASLWIISVAGLLTWHCSRHTWLGHGFEERRDTESFLRYNDRRVESLIRDMPMVCNDVSTGVTCERGSAPVHPSCVFYSICMYVDITTPASDSGHSPSSAFPGGTNNQNVGTSKPTLLPRLQMYGA